MANKETKVYTPEELHAWDFVHGARDFSTMVEARPYKLMKAMVDRSFCKLDKAERDREMLHIMESVSHCMFADKGVWCQAGWAFDFRPFMNRYVYKQHSSWEECYGFSKTLVRKMISGISEIHEIPNKRKEGLA